MKRAIELLEFWQRRLKPQSPLPEREVEREAEMSPEVQFAVAQPWMMAGGSGPVTKLSPEMHDMISWAEGKREIIGSKRR